MTGLWSPPKEVFVLIMLLSAPVCAVLDHCGFRWKSFSAPSTLSTVSVCFYASNLSTTEKNALVKEFFTADFTGIPGAFFWTVFWSTYLLASTARWDGLLDYCACNYRLIREY